MNKFTIFLNGYNTVKINNQQEYNILMKKISNVDSNAVANLSYEKMINLAILNGRRLNDEYQGYLLIEYDCYKGITFSCSEEKSISYYDQRPFTVYEL